MSEVSYDEVEELFDAIRSGLIKAGWKVVDGAEDSIIITPDLVDEPVQPSRYIVRVMKLPN